MRMIGVGKGVADHDLGKACDGDDVTCDGLVRGRPLDALGGE